MDKNKKRASGKCDQTQKPAKSIRDLCDKGNKNNSNPKYQRTLNLFLKGGKYTVIQLTEALQIADPRSLIRRLRNDNIPISDYWQKSEYSRFKVYFLHTDTATEPSDNSGGQDVEE